MAHLVWRSRRGFSILSVDKATQARRWPEIRGRVQRIMSAVLSTASGDNKHFRRPGILDVVRGAAAAAVRDGYVQIVRSRRTTPQQERVCCAAKTRPPVLLHKLLKIGHNT